jgi:hypothetical protein
MCPDRKAKDGPPRWVKVFGAVAFLLVSIVAAVHLGGGMGHLGHAGPPLVEHSSHAPQL